jgi:hypothetical protein
VQFIAPVRFRVICNETTVKVAWRSSLISICMFTCYWKCPVLTPSLTMVTSMCRAGKNADPRSTTGCSNNLTQHRLDPCSVLRPQCETNDTAFPGHEGQSTHAMVVWPAPSWSSNMWACLLLVCAFSTKAAAHCVTKGERPRFPSRSWKILGSHFRGQSRDDPRKKCISFFTSTYCSVHS